MIQAVFGEGDVLFPAYAGVIPGEIFTENYSLTFPRMRGGDPGMSSPAFMVNFFSPHARG